MEEYERTFEDTSDGNDMKEYEREEYECIFKEVRGKNPRHSLNIQNTGWRKVMILEGEKGPHTPYHCVLCDGYDVNRKGKCNINKAAVKQHYTLRKLLLNWKCRNHYTQVWVQKQRKGMCQTCKKHTPTG